MRRLVTKPVSEIRAIESLIKKCKDLYYNRGTYYKAPVSEQPRYMRTDKPVVMTDARYDKLEQKLTELDPTNKLLHAVRTTSVPNATVNGLKKVKLPAYMGSLRKVRTAEDIQAWATEFAGPYVISDKADGVSLLLQQKNGVKRLFRPGDDTTGQEITHMLTEVDVPDFKGDYLVRGEFIMSKAKFESKWAATFKNARNMIGGITNRKDAHEALGDASFLVFEVLSPRLKPSRGLAWAKSKGFTVVPHKVFPALPSPDALTKLLLKRRGGRYEADGLVIEQDAVHPLNKKAFPDWAVAFKSELADDYANAEVTEVQWRPTRLGYLAPRIMVKPVKLRGVTVTFTNGKSAAVIRDNKIGPGAVIKLRRSGDVIPDMKKGDVIKPAKTWQRPPATLQWAWNESQTNIVLTDKKAVRNSDTQSLVLEHFFSTIGVERIKAATLLKFMDAGYATVSSILKLNRAKFTSIEGGSKILDAVYDQLQQKLKDVDLPTLMDASSIFGRGFGTTQCRKIVQGVPNLLKMADKPAAVTQAIDDLHGFDHKTASRFAERLPVFVKWLAKTGLNPITEKKVKQVGNKLVGQSVIMTGFRDADLELEIKKHGGQIASSPSKATILLCKDPASTSAKMQAARAAGIKILTAAQFKSKYGIQ